MTKTQADCWAFLRADPITSVYLPPDARLILAEGDDLSGWRTSVLPGGEVAVTMPASLLELLAEIATANRDTGASLGD